MSNTLARICDDKKAHVEKKKSAASLEDLKEKIKSIPAPRGFIKNLESALTQNNIPLIAEVKKASPSKGIIREDFDPVATAKIYETAGASCLSVLTDMPYFQGHDQFLQDIHEAVRIPLLRKDFMVDPYQIFESRTLGADCILIIMAALNDDTAKELFDITMELGMDALIEVHDQEELDRAIALNPQMIGVNSRNLKTLEVDIQVAHDLIRQIPESTLKVAESGIGNHNDIKSLQSVGAQAFLVGESLMRQKNIAAATKNLLGTN